MKIRDGKIACFKAYDARGRVPDELDAALAVDIAQAYVEVVGARRVAVGYDIRLTSPAIAHAVMEGLNRAGADVVSIGQCGTEEIYFATAHLGLDGGIMVTASHNPKDYNGMKFVREDARPISGDTGLVEIATVGARGGFESAAQAGSVEEVDNRPAYLEHLMSYVDVSALRPLRIVANAGNGCAGPVLDELEKRLPFTFVKLQNEPDGNFPNGVPNPLLLENRALTADAVRREGADLAIAWDGDFDRCFFFDERGEFIEGYYIVGLLAKLLLAKNPGGKIVHDPRLVWNTAELVGAAGGEVVQSKSGHAFIKEKMRNVDALYGGEMSAHHYFRDFSYCDSGMIPWLLVAAALSSDGRPFSKLVEERLALFPASGEINRRVDDAAVVFEKVDAKYRPFADSVDEIDGLSMNFGNWRFNLRRSNTEPLVRLNVETRGDVPLMETKTAELLELVDG